MHLSRGVYPRDVHKAFFSRDRGETETLKPETEAEAEALTIKAEARPRPRPSELETRPRHTNSEARPSRGTTTPRDGLETEASIKTEAMHIPGLSPLESQYAVTQPPMSNFPFNVERLPRQT